MILRTSSLLVMAAMVACAPVRDDVGEGGGGGDTLESAVYFQWGEQARDYTIAGIHLVGADYGCDDAFDFEVHWWGLPVETEWFSVTLLKGTNLDAWSRIFPSYYSFQQEGDWDYPNSAYFSGTYGVGGGGEGDDDDVPPVGRDVQGYLGQELNQLADTVEITSHSETRVSGVASGSRRIDGEFEDYRFRFDATNCGVLEGGVVVGRGEGGDDP